MKRTVYIITLFLISLSFSCNEEEFLKEEAKDLFTAENAYQEPNDFEMAVTRIYDQVRDNFYNAWPPWHSMYYWVATDMAWDAIATTHGYNFYEKVIPGDRIVEYFWNNNYNIIKNANTILGKIDNEDIVFSSDIERNRLKAEAHFFRAWSYRFLGIMYGGVPIVLTELTEPKRDFQRAPVQDVWAQAISDLNFAVENLPSVTERKADGKLTKAAANHLLAELYIITEEYDKAITSASAVIDDPNYELMRNRFGSRMDEPGDVYWDLFRRENQNRSGGNTESIWVCQYEYNVDGGGRDNRLLWCLGPQYWNLKDPNDEYLFFSFSSQHGGRSIGWMSSSSYMDTIVWERSGWNEDIRNSEYNIWHDMVSDNPESVWYGQKIIESGALDVNPNHLRQKWHAFFTKIAPINNFPSETIADPETGEVTNEGSRTFRDTYVYRLAETYLLRAEAYLRAGQPDLAADDINEVRSRASAPRVSAGDVDIDYILDERARELCWEGTYRQLTLRRMGKLVERVREYNPISGPTIKEHHQLMPIPQSEIERNTEAKLEQNPGYF